MTEITNPAVFFAASAVVVGYIVYMMFRKRRGVRKGQIDREPEL